MRKFLIAALLMILPATAYAGWNIKQNADGSTVWIDSNGNTLPVAGSGALFATITDLSNPATVLLVNIRPGKIKAVYGIAHDASSLSGTAPTVTVFKQTTENTNGFEPLSSAGTTGFSVPKDLVDSGSVDLTNADANTVTAGQVLAIVTDGASAGSTAGTITIVIE